VDDGSDQRSSVKRERGGVKGGLVVAVPGVVPQLVEVMLNIAETARQVSDIECNLGTALMRQTSRLVGAGESEGLVATSRSSTKGEKGGTSPLFFVH
jgi:hypothetical protein